MLPTGNVRAAAALRVSALIGSPCPSLHGRAQRNGPGARDPSGTVGGVFVKICGITNEEDALLAVAMGADALGFVFASGSPRQVTPDDGARHRAPLAPRHDDRSASSATSAPERVVEIVNTVGLSGAQLHGREPMSEARMIRAARAAS